MCGAASSPHQPLHQFRVAVTLRPAFLSGLHLQQGPHRGKLVAAGTEAVPTKALVFIHGPCPLCRIRSAWISPAGPSRSTRRLPRSRKPFATAPGRCQDHETTQPSQHTKQVARDRSARPSPAGTCMVRRTHDHPVPGLLGRDHRACAHRGNLRRTLQARPDDLDQALVLVDDVPLWLGHQARPGARARDRSLRLSPLAHRTIQIGLSGEAARRYVSQWVLQLRDVTSLVREVGALVRTTAGVLPLLAVRPGLRRRLISTAPALSAD